MTESCIQLNYLIMLLVEISDLPLFQKLAQFYKTGKFLNMTGSCIRNFSIMLLVEISELSLFQTLSQFYKIG